VIPIVEDYLSELIEKQLAYLKGNPNHLDKILQMSPSRMNMLKTFIQGNETKPKPIKVIRGYPRTPTELPCIAILLSAEEETQDSLGDHGNEAVTGMESVTIETVVVDRPKSGYGAPHIKLPNVPIENVSSVVDNAMGLGLDEDDYELVNPQKGIVAVYDSDLQDGSPVTVSYTYLTDSVEELETMYDLTYRIEVWTNNGDLTVQLYHLLKWALMSKRDDLVSDYNLFKQKLSGADFEPVPAYFPEFVYRRALSLACTTHASVPNGEEFGYIDSITVEQTVIPSKFTGGDIDG